MSRRAVIVSVILAAVLAGPLPARAAVDVEIANAQKVFGTFDPPGESETFRVRIPAGALLSVTLKGKKQKGGTGKPAVTFQLFNEADAELATGLIKRGKTSAKLKKFEIVASGLHRVVVQGDGATVGDYLLKVKWKSRKKFTADVDLADGTKNVPFAIDAGATCDFTAKAAKGSAAEPTLDVVDLFGGGTVHTFTPPSAGSNKHVEKKVLLEDAGDHVLEVSSTGAGGLAKVTVKAKPPKTDKKAKVELTSKVLGVGDAIGAVVGPGGGSFEVEGAGDLDGAAVDVPPGALTKPTVIIVASGIDIGEVPGEDTDPGGPPVFFGPEGIRFQGDVTIVVPFDPDLFDDEGDVQVAVRDEDGNVVLVPVSDFEVDLVAGTVTVMVPHFSTYQVVGPAGLERSTPGDLNGDGFPDIVFATGSAEAGGNAKDSVHVFFGVAPLPAATSSTSGVVFTEESGGDLFGAAFAVGDLNGDKQDDLAIGARDANGINGRVYVFFGGAGFAGSTDPLNDADVVITGRNGESFGGSVVIGNVVGDGTPDLIASSFGFSPDNFPQVFAFSGGPALTTGDTGGASVTLSSTVAFTAFTARAAGDVNGDGRDDLITSNFNTGGSDALYIWFGGSALEVASPPNETSASVTLADATGSGNIGREGVALGDLVGDGNLDVIAMAPTYQTGVIHVFAGGVGLADKNATAADVAIERATGSFGNGRLVAGNLDGVGKDELIFADEEDSVSGFQRGLAYVFRSIDLSTTMTQLEAFQTIGGTEEQARLGAFASGGDFDADGRFDLLLAAPNSNRGGIDVGRVYVFRGPADLANLPAVDTAADMIITGQAGEFLGSQLFGVGKR